MGRPLKKKLFGEQNTNIADTPLDNNIGGEGIQYVDILDAGNYIATVPSVTFPPPDIPGGVQATGDAHGKLVQIWEFDSPGSGYNPADILTVLGGSNTIVATLVVTAVVTGTVEKTADGINYDVGDEIWFEGAGWSVPLKLLVETTTAGGVLDTFSILQPGVWVGPANAPLSVTGTETHNGPLDSNGAGATFTLTWGVRDADILSEGDYDVAPLDPISFSTTPPGGAGVLAHLRWGIRHVEITQRGSGYSDQNAAAPIFTVAAGVGTAQAVGVSWMTHTTDNALVGVDISTGAKVDIAKQESSTSYWVNTFSGPKLLFLANPTTSIEGLYLKATDSSGFDYAVKKLTANKATLSPVAGAGEFKEGDVVLWTFNTPIPGIKVKINNA